MDKKSSSGLGFCGVLTIVFIVLKLTGVISWSWWWVFSPIWIDLLLAGILILIAVAINHAEERRLYGRSKRWKKYLQIYMYT